MLPPVEQCAVGERRCGRDPRSTRPRAPRFLPPRAASGTGPGPPRRHFPVCQRGRLTEPRVCAATEEAPGEPWGRRSRSCPSCSRCWPSGRLRPRHVDTENVSPSFTGLACCVDTASRVVTFWRGVLKVARTREFSFLRRDCSVLCFDVYPSMRVRTSGHVSVEVEDVVCRHLLISVLR